MALLPTDQRDQIKFGVAFVAFALGLAYYLYPYSDRQLQLDEQLAHVEKLEAQNERAEREIARGTAQTLKAQAARSRASLEVLRTLVPTEHEVPALLEQVSTAARRANLELGGVQPEPVLAGDDFDTHRYKVTVVGTYHALTSFLANVGSLPRIVAPVTFALVPSTKGLAVTGKPGAPPPQKFPLQATVTIQTYVAHATPPAAPKGAAPARQSAGEVTP